MSREHKTRVEAVLARIAIVGFAALSAFYSLYVSWAGRLNVETGEPDGLVRALSGLLSSLKLGGLAERLNRLGTGDILLALVLFAAVCFAGEICFRGRKRADLRQKIQKWILPVFIAVGVLWVIFRLNNTSLYAWSFYIGGNNGAPLTGSARMLRWDEYCLWTPMALSQESLGWPVVNTLIGNGTDVTWVSMGGLPAWSAATVFKPLYWGFLLLGADRGLSFLCITRLILLFVVSRKTAMLYTKGNKGMSMLAAVILTLSPMTQWFFSQSVAEILIFSQGMFLAMHGLIKSELTWKRILYGLLHAWLLGCLVMVGYPAWIIPVVYLLLAAGIILFTRRSVEHRGKKAGVLLASLVPALILIGVIVYGSWDTLMAVRNSAYPGSRLITGGLPDSSRITGAVWNPALKAGLASVFFPLSNVKMSISNYVDMAPILSFAPAGLVLSVWHQIREKKADPFEIIVASLMAFFWLFTFVPLPAWLCKITLLSQCSRPAFLIGICEVILLIRARAKGGIQDKRLAAVAALLSTIFCLACIKLSGVVVLGTAQFLIVAVLYIFTFLAVYVDFKADGTRLAIFFLCCVLFLAGGFVNPVQHGLDMLDDFELVSTLKSIGNEDGDLYAVDGDYPLTNVPLMAGKHCINTDQPYADLERWTAIDPEGKNEDVYNRLCHVIISLAGDGEETEFREEGNHIYLTLTRADLAALGVNYLITPRDELDDAEMVAFDEADGLYVWKLKN